jgi:hypothetical protein
MNEKMNEDVSRETLSNENGIFIEYDLKPEEILSGMKFYHKQTIYKKNLIYTIILGLFVGFELYSSAVANSFGTRAILMALVLGVIVIIWYAPFNRAKQLSRAIEQDDAKYNMTIFSDRFVVETEKGEVESSFSDFETKKYFLDDLLILTVGKEKLYIIPKRCIQDKWQDIKTLTERNEI